MTFQSLFVVNDDSAAQVLSQALADFQVHSDRYSELETAISKLEEKRFDAVVVDFDDSQTAVQLLTRVRQSSTSSNAVTIALLSDPTQVRSALTTGANFVLYKPVSSEKVQVSLRAAIALLKRERRRNFRVPVQVPVVLSWQGASEVEGIVLDLSEDGMDLLSAQPLHVSQELSLQFSLPDGTEIQVCGQVVWANGNGQAGVHFGFFPEAKKQALCTWLSANVPEAVPDEPELLSQCRLTDLSLGGCYVETGSPFPLRTKIELYLSVPDNEVHATGIVCVMHPEHGMGIEFSSQRGEGCGQIARFIDCLASQTDVTPRFSVVPRSLSFALDQSSDQSEPSAVDDPLLQLLRRAENLSQDEFLTELRNQRRSAEAMA